MDAALIVIDSDEELSRARAWSIGSGTRKTRLISLGCERKRV